MNMIICVATSIYSGDPWEGVSVVKPWRSITAQTTVEVY
jgi:hypothetical protein